LGRTSCEALCASPGVWSGAALGFSGPCDRRGLKPRHLESARAAGSAGGNLAAEQVANCFVGNVPPRRSAQDGASGEESMLALDTPGRQRHRRVKKAVATHGDWWQRRSRAGGVLAGGATPLRDVSATCVAQCRLFGPSDIATSHPVAWPSIPRTTRRGLATSGVCHRTRSPRRDARVRLAWRRVYAFDPGSRTSAHASR
jgi:hypothetical protein